MTEWSLVRLGDIAADEKSAISKPYGSAIVRDDYRDAGVPVVRGVNLARGRFYDDEFVFISEDLADRMPGARLLPGDLVFTHRGSVGQISMIPRAPRFQQYTLSTSQVKARLDPTRAIPEFFYYWFLSPAGRHSILQSISTVGVPGLARPVETIKSLPVPLPPLEEQQRIAGVLGALDDLIDTDRRLARQLDSYLVTSWAASARRCHTERVLGELVELRKGVSYKGTFLSEHGLPLINLANFALDGSFKESGTKHYLGPVKDRQLLSKGSLVVANTDLTQRCEILARPLLVPFQAATSTHHTFQIDVRGSDARRGWIFCALRTEVIRRRLISFATGTTVAALPADALLSQEIPWASDQIIDGWWSKASALRKAQESVAAEVSELERAREEVLPLLMSGRLHVEDVSV